MSFIPTAVTPDLLKNIQNLAWVEQYAENAWMKLGDTSIIQIDNPFHHRTAHDIANPHVFLLDLMRKPEYFFFTCRWLLGKTLPPMQLAILRELWMRPFPMLIGSRGMGKCVKGNTLVHTNSGICRIEQLAKRSAVMERVYQPGLSILGEAGFKDVEYSWNNGLSDTIVLRTKKGFEIEGTLNHPIRVVTDKGVEWKQLADITSDDVVPIDRTESWHEPTETLPDDLAYLLGLITGDGGYTIRGRISFTTADYELIMAASAIAKTYWGQPFHDVPSSPYSYIIHGVELWDSFFDKYGFTSSECGKKDFPTSILKGSKSACAAFVRGLFDTDGGVEKDRVSFSAKSETMVRTLQFVLSRFGIVAKRRPKLNKKYNKVYWHLEIQGEDVKRFAEHIGFGLPRKATALKSLIAKPSNPNLDVVPASLVLDDILALASRIPRRKKGEGRRSTHLNPSRLRAYGCTYQALDIVLTLTENQSETDEWKRLRKIYEKHWYYDKIKELSSGQCVTYDVHVPDGHSFISNGIISHNSFLLAVYAILRALFCPGSKIIICGAAFRQAKVVFDYCADIWDKAPVLRSLFGNDRANGPRRDVDRCILRMGDSIIIAIPLGDGTKIRGQRANIIIAEEFASIPVDIFETVVRGFAAVNMDPVSKIQREARIEAMQSLGLWTPEQEELGGDLSSNQTIISGTAYYAFNHFYEYWRRYKNIIESKGDPHRLNEIFNGEIPDKFNWRDYCVIRVPVRMLPKGLMDMKQIGQARATVALGIYQMEYGAIFPTDSNGFFRRTLIEGCVVGRPAKPIIHESCGEVRFGAVLRGIPNRRYVIAVDPASEKDNFSIVVLELWKDHRRIVHCWTTTRARFKAKAAKGLVEDQDFYGYAARRIRDLKRIFPAERIAIDTQGGGVAVMEALQDPKRLKDGEQPILPTIVEDDPKPTDDQPGEHILELISFAKADWVAAANHGMRKDFEDKQLLFPEFDSAVMGLAIEEDRLTGRVKMDPTDQTIEKLYDTLEDCVLEIEDMKDELATIVHTQTGTSMRDRWDTPETKGAGGKKGRLRKDRYSSLLMANMVGRQLQRAPVEQEYKSMGGFAKTLADVSGGRAPANGSMYIAPDWWTQKAPRSESYGAVARH